MVTTFIKLANNDICNTERTIEVNTDVLENKKLHIILEDGNEIVERFNTTEDLDAEVARFQGTFLRITEKRMINIRYINKLEQSVANPATVVMNFYDGENIFIQMQTEEKALELIAEIRSALGLDDENEEE